MPLPPFVFRALPLVEGLVHHKEAELVAKIEQRRIGRIVGGADRVAAHGLELLQPPAPHRRGYGGAQRARIVMHANALELHGNAVQEKAFVRIENGGAHAEADALGICNFPTLHRFAFQRIKIRGFGAPQVCPRQRELGFARI